MIIVDIGVNYTDGIHIADMRELRHLALAARGLLA